MILSNGPVLNVPSDDLRAPDAPGAIAIAAAAAHGNQPLPYTGPKRNMRAALDDAERQQVLTALEQSSWTVAGANGAAALLGMKRSTLQSRMRKLGIRISRTGA